LTMNQDWPGTYKEFDPLPRSARIMIPIPETDISPLPSVTSKLRSTNSKCQHVSPYKKKTDCKRKRRLLCRRHK
jgi:hypothetical protein